MKTPQLILSGGNVITMEEPIRAIPSDVVVCDGRILAITPPGDLSGTVGPETTVKDYSGKTILPGLIDSHNHMLMYGQNLEAVELTAAKAKSLEDVVRLLKAAAAKTPPGEWIKGWGFQEAIFPEKVLPNKEWLDRASTENPIYIYRGCVHVMVVNSLALEKAGITTDTPDPEGGKIGRDSQGNPNGIFYELAAMDLITRHIPKPDVAACTRALEKAAKVYLSEGLTLVSEAGAGFTGNTWEAPAFLRLWQQDAPMPRISLGLMDSTYRLYPEDGGPGLATGFGNDRLWVGPVKFVLDGTITANTAAMCQPYENSDKCGVLCEDPATLTRNMEQAHLAGFQISVHVIGDHAVDTVLTAYEAILDKHPRAHRHRIEHASVCRPDLMKRIARLGLITVVQPGFIYDYAISAVEALGSKRLTHIWPFRSLIESGITVVGSSDRPVIDGYPWNSIWGAVNRTTSTNGVFNAEEVITTAQALKMYTVNAAYANFMEDRLGTLSPGKYADMVIVDENPLELDPMELKNVKVLETYIEGENVFSRD